MADADMAREDSRPDFRGGDAEGPRRPGRFNAGGPRGRGGEERDEEGGSGGFRGGRRSRRFHRDQLEKAGKIDYKNLDLLRHFVTDRGKIRPSRQTNLSQKQQRAITRAVKRARHMALLPYTDKHTHDS